MAAKFTPLHDRILVLPAKGETIRTTKGGLYIPDSAQEEKNKLGEVVSVGTGRIDDKGEVRPLAVKAGDQILFGKYGGTPIVLDGEEYVIMREDEVLGIVSK